MARLPGPGFVHQEAASASFRRLESATGRAQRYGRSGVSDNEQMPSSPFGKVDRENQRAVQGVSVPAVLAELVPAFEETAVAVTYEQMALESQVTSDTTAHSAVRLLFSLALNDLLDLLEDLRLGSGRSAMRAARALLEHAINLHTVISSLAEASRYLEHLDQGPAMMLQLAPGRDRLDGQVRRDYVHALSSKGRPAARNFEASVAEHGPWFRRGWTQISLKDRAGSHGLERLYEYYKLGSLVVHGSSGGSLGTIHDHPEGYRVFRTGPSLELAPVAMWAGLVGYREVLAALQEVRTDIDMGAYMNALDAMDELWGEYFTAMTEIDRSLWPKERVPPPSAILAFSQNRKRRWYLHLPMSACLIPAMDPELTEGMEQELGRLIDATVSGQAHLFRADQRWLCVRVLDVTVSPRAGAQPIPETALFQHSPDGWNACRAGNVDETPP